MRCASCGFENPEGMKFCGQCAAPLPPRCPQCGFENPPGFTFCGQCATPLTRQLALASSQLSVASPQPPACYTPPHLAERILAEQAAMATRGVTDGERKTITALFADLKGSTALIESLDPEEARAIIDPALQIMMEAVHRYEGYVAQALGDGILALFGAPIAHEDHPQRALYAALRMQDEMRRYSDMLREQGRPPLLMRVGVNTGEVVVRSIHKDDLHTDYVPVGHSTNLAARMEQLAAPGSILVTEQTHKLTQGYFEDVEKLFTRSRFVEQYDEMVLVKEIDFASLCEHHILPFYGKCHVAYIPDGKILGLSKIPRLVDILSRRLQVQERLTTQIADALKTHLNPKGVAVVMEAQHLCTMMRGVQKQNTRMVTSSMLGTFRTDPKTRMEFLSLLREKNP